MNKVMYCRFCNEKHIVSETVDGDGNVVGVFCNREKALITAFTTHWNSEDLQPRVASYTRANTDLRALSKVKGNKLRGLAKRFAFLAMKSDFVTERKLNYAFLVHLILDELFILKEQAFQQKEWL